MSTKKVEAADDTVKIPRMWSAMIKDGEDPYDSTGVYPCGTAFVGEYALTEPGVFTIVRHDELKALLDKARAAAEPLEMRELREGEVIAAYMEFDRSADKSSWNNVEYLTQFGMFVSRQTKRTNAQEGRTPTPAPEAEDSSGPGETQAFAAFAGKSRTENMTLREIEERERRRFEVVARGLGIKSFTMECDNHGKQTGEYAFPAARYAWKMWKYLHD